MSDSLWAEFLGSIAPDLNSDERAIVRRGMERRIARLMLGRQKYGPLDLDGDHRDWLEEAGQEMDDGGIYFDFLAEKQSRGGRR